MTAIALKLEVPPGKPLIISSRTFAAPRALVWEAMTTPKHLVRWWGPRLYKNRITDYDLRVGGKWRIEQTDEKGNVYAFHGVFREIAPLARLVQTFGLDGMFDNRVVIEDMTLEAVAEATRYRVVSTFETLADRDGMVASGMEWGARESMERLDELLAEIHP